MDMCERRVIECLRIPCLCSAACACDLHLSLWRLLSVEHVDHNLSLQSEDIREIIASIEEP